MQKKRIWILMLVLSLMALPLAGCTDDGGDTTTDEGSDEETTDASTGSALDAFEGLSGELNMAGSTTIGPHLMTVAEQIMAEYPDIEIFIEGGGSGVGVQKIGEDVVDIGLMTRGIKDEEAELYPDIYQIDFVLDGVAIVVHPDNPVTGLDSEQLLGIYTGAITNWADVGGNAGTIKVFQRDEASSTRELLAKYIGIDPEEYGPDSGVADSAPGMAALVEGDPNGIGFIGFGAGDADVKFIAVDGVESTVENLLNGTLPMSRAGAFTLDSEPEGLVKAYIDYVMSGEVDDVFESKGLIPVE